MHLSVILVIAILLLISGVIWIASKRDKQQETIEVVDVPAETPLETTLDAVKPSSPSTDIQSEKTTKEEAPEEINNQQKKTVSRTE